MAHPRADEGSHAGGDQPIGDLDEWRAPGRQPWVTGLTRVHPSVTAGMVRAVLGGAVVLGLLFGGWWLLRPPPPPIETALPLAETGETGSSVATTVPSVDPTPADEIVVQAAGAVGRPGVHRLPAGSRVDDLVHSAGGLAPDADADRVNLAAPLQDGERIWVPRVGEDEVPELVPGSGVAPTGSDETGSEPAPVNLNTASSTELEGLPGIGPATASAILTHRDQIGTFESVDELIEVRGIGEAKLEQVRPLVTV